MPSFGDTKPTRRDVNLPAPRCGQQFVEAGPAIIRARHAAVRELGGGPVSSGDIKTELGELVLRFLVEGGIHGRRERLSSRLS
jgi:hypothetical protein